MSEKPSSSYNNRGSAGTAVIIGVGSSAKNGESYKKKISSNEVTNTSTINKDQVTQSNYLKQASDKSSF